LPVSDADEVLYHILAAREKIQATIEKCRPLVSKLKVDSYLLLRYASNDEFSCEWIDRAKTLEFFEDSIHQDSIEQINGHPVYVCTLDSKFNDGFLDLKHSTMVARVTQQ